MDAGKDLSNKGLLCFVHFKSKLVPSLRLDEETRGDTGLAILTINTDTIVSLRHLNISEMSPSHIEPDIVSL